jgi:hypothetical protein
VPGDARDRRPQHCPLAIHVACELHAFVSLKSDFNTIRYSKAPEAATVLDGWWCGRRNPLALPNFCARPDQRRHDQLWTVSAKHGENST